MPKKTDAPKTEAKAASKPVARKARASEDAPAPNKKGARTGTESSPLKSSRVASGGKKSLAAEVPASTKATKPRAKAVEPQKNNAQADAAPAGNAVEKRSRQPAAGNAAVKAPEPEKAATQARRKTVTTKAKVEKDVGKSTLGKIAKAVTDQVSALADKVAGGKKGTKKTKTETGDTDKPAAGKTAAAKSVSPAPEAKSAKKAATGSAGQTPEAKASASSGTKGKAAAATSAPATPAPALSVSGGAKTKVSAPKAAVAKAASSRKDETPREDETSAPAGKKGAKATSSQPSAREAAEAADTAPRKGAARAKGKSAASDKAALKGEQPEKTENGTDTEALIRSEEDITAPAASDVREQIFHERYAHVAPRPPRDLPNEYGDTRIVLLVRDPEWVYAYWEVNDATRQELQIPRSGHNRRMVVRFYKITDRKWPEEAAHYFFDVEVSPYAHNWYVKLPETSQQWCAELGMFTEPGEYLMIARSNYVATPRDTVSTETDSDWMTVEETYQKLYGLSAGYAAANAVLRGEAGVGASERLLRHLQRQVAAGLRGQMDMSSSGLYSGSSEAAPQRDAQAGVKDFWLQVHTELVLYGSTEPDAAVTVQGRPIKLNPDGTFSLRYALPDGEQVLRVHATNRDGDLEQEVTPVVTRKTRKS